MASTLASRAALAERVSSLWRIPIASSLRNLSTSSASGAPNPSSTTPASSAAGKSRRKKKKNLFEVAQFLPNWGLGFHMAKTHWSNVSYEITKINLYKDGRHGKAWGIAYKDGSPAAPAKKISGVHKRCWRYIPNSKTIEEGTSKSEVKSA